MKFEVEAVCESKAVITDENGTRHCLNFKWDDGELSEGGDSKHLCGHSFALHVSTKEYFATDVGDRLKVEVSSKEKVS